MNKGLPLQLPSSNKLKPTKDCVLCWWRISLLLSQNMADALRDVLGGLSATK